MLDPQTSSEDPERSGWRRLLHRWLVQYNPLYLVSAAFVLVGVILLSRGVAHGGGALGQLGITAIAELYAWTLIGGAALLVRIRLRRPAVMLALLVAVYQGDLTLHTETSAHLGWIGPFATAGWLLSFVAKLAAIAWALRLRLSAAALAVPTIAGVGLALIPWLLRVLDPRTATSLVGAWIFAVFATALWSYRHVVSIVALDGWAALVKARALRATWLGWAAMLLGHVLFWHAQQPKTVHVAVLLPVGVLLATRFCRHEATVWCAVIATLSLTAVATPAYFAIAACLAAAALALRAFRRPDVVLRIKAGAPVSFGPYRDDADDAPSVAPEMPPEIAFALAQRRAMPRLLAGAVGCLYLALWTLGWTGGEWPAHALWLDLLLVATTLVTARRLRSPIPLVMPIATAMHFAVPTPSSVAQWGGTCVGVGFALLLFSLAASVRWRSWTPSG